MMTNKEQSKLISDKKAAIKAIKAYMSANRRYCANNDAIDVYESFLHDTNTKIDSKMLESAIYKEIEYFQVNNS